MLAVRDPKSAEKGNYFKLTRYPILGKLVIPQNPTMRMSMRRFTQLTNAFSRKAANHAHNVALHFMHYNYCHVHQTLRVTPAMRAGLIDPVWEIEELLKLID